MNQNASLNKLHEVIGVIPKLKKSSIFFLMQKKKKNNHDDDN